MAWSGSAAAAGPGAGMRQRAPGTGVVRRGRGAGRPGLLALRSASGLSPGPRVRAGLAPTAFNRAGEKARATWGQLPGVLYEVVLSVGAGSLSPSAGKGSGHPGG